jgi:hypothetical protein
MQAIIRQEARKKKRYVEVNQTVRGFADFYAAYTTNGCKTLFTSILEKYVAIS